MKIQEIPCYMFYFPSIILTDCDAQLTLKSIKNSLHPKVSEDKILNTIRCHLNPEQGIFIFMGLAAYSETRLTFYICEVG